MKRYASRVAVLVLGTIFLTGCVIAVNTDDWEQSDWYKQQSRNADRIEALTLGDPEAEIVAFLGDADFVESFVRGEKEYRVLHYRTHHVKHDGITTRDETTPVVFQDGILVGWGESAIAHVIEADAG